MSKTKLLPLVAITIIVASFMLGFYKAPISKAFTPTENAYLLATYNGVASRRLY